MFGQTNWSTNHISPCVQSLNQLVNKWHFLCVQQPLKYVLRTSTGCDVYVPLCNIVDVSNVCWRLCWGVYASLSVAESNKATCKKVDSVYSSTTQEHRTVLKQNLLRILSTVHSARSKKTKQETLTSEKIMLWHLLGHETPTAKNETDIGLV